jgi:hypothetical protein
VLTGIGCGSGTVVLCAMPRAEPTVGAIDGLTGMETGMIRTGGGRVIGAGGRTG